MVNPFLAAALQYCDMGFSVIPLIPGLKKPLIKWEPFQTIKADRNAITSWWMNTPKANVGIVTGKISNLFVVDLDRYKDQFDDDVAIKIFSDSLVVPSATTPQNGEHLYFRCPDNTDLKGVVNEEIAIDVRAEGNYIVAPPSVNGNGNPYQWTNSIFDTPLAAPGQVILDNIYAFIYKESVDGQNLNRLRSLQTSSSVYKMFTVGRRDQDLFHIANQLAISRTSEDEIRQVINILAKNCNPPFPENEIEAKIISALNRNEKREKSFAQEIKEWVCLQEGTFNLQTVYNCLQVSTRMDKKNVSIILKRISEGEDRLIDKITGGNTGTYRTINKNLKVINLSDRSDLHGELAVEFPLGIESLIKPMPGCVYVIAGESDSGKSAFLMNFAKKNVDSFQVHYFSTEMGKQEFLDRADYFWPDAATNTNFHFYERYDDFDQVIFPDDINIIDYLELFDNFYLMAGFIKKIGKALGKGIAFIALQKPKGRETGEGGERTKNLPRLYLSLAPNKLKIVKAKNWRNSKMNPNRLQIEFKLVEGCKFTNTSSWRRMEDDKCTDE
jgi:hypothetical protein